MRIADADFPISEIFESIQGEGNYAGVNCLFVRFQLCNLTCTHCYIESSPRNDRLSYISAAEVRTYLDEIGERSLGTEEIGFTGGEPFMNPDIVAMLEDSLSRIDRYSTAGAEMLGKSQRRISFATGITRGAWAFFRAYVLRAGFLDGPEGFLLAVATAEGTYYRYMKAWLAGRRRD